MVVPPLRSRREEIAPLARLFAAHNDLSDEAVALLHAHSWPGNVRELRNAIERAVLVSTDLTIRPEHLALESGPIVTVSAAAPSGQPAHAERDRLLEALARHGGNQTRTAAFLGISRNTLLARLERHGIRRPRKH